MPEFTDVAKLAAAEVADQVATDIDRKIAHWKAKLEEIPNRIKELEGMRKPLIKDKVNRRLAQLQKAGIKIEVPPADLGLKTH